MGNYYLCVSSPLVDNGNLIFLKKIFIYFSHGLSCSVACGIFSDRRSNLSLLHWWVDSLSLSHPGNLIFKLFTSKLNSVGDFLWFYILVKLGIISLLAISGGCVVISHYDFNFHFYYFIEIEYLVIWLLAIKNLGCLFLLICSRCLPYFVCQSFVSCLCCQNIFSHSMAYL